MILLTGSTGFIGRALLVSLLQKHKVRCIVRDQSSLSLKHKNLEVMSGLLTNHDHVEKAVKGVSCIIHLSAPFLT